MMSNNVRFSPVSQIANDECGEDSSNDASKMMSVVKIAVMMRVK